MFNKDLFTYNEETHTGTYNGEPIPSITQCLGVMFPMNENIPTKRLENASDKGTTIHSAIETLNTYFDNPFEYQHNIDVVVEIAGKVAKHKNIPELVDYACMIATYKLKPFNYEELVFLLDENGDLICYGHYDCTFQAMEDIEPFRQDRLYMCDFKTTSTFEKQRNALQLSAYALAYEQASKNLIDSVFGMWLRNGAKIVPLKRHDNQYIIQLFKKLKELWLNTLNQ